MIRLQIAGPLGSDAEVRHLDNGRAAISFSVAHSEKWKDAQGNQQERTTWVRCTIWRKSDQIGIAQYLTKGTKVIAEGNPSARAWANSQGQPQASLELTVQNIELMSTRPAGQVNNAPVNQHQGSTTPAASKSAFNDPGIANAFDDTEDLPF